MAHKFRVAILGFGICLSLFVSKIGWFSKQFLTFLSRWGVSAMTWSTADAGHCMDAECGSYSQFSWIHPNRSPHFLVCCSQSRTQTQTRSPTLCAATITSLVTCFTTHRRLTCTWQTRHADVYMVHQLQNRCQLPGELYVWWAAGLNTEYVPLLASLIRKDSVAFVELGW